MSGVPYSGDSEEGTTTNIVEAAFTPSYGTFNRIGNFNPTYNSWVTILLNNTVINSGDFELNSSGQVKILKDGIYNINCGVYLSPNYKVRIYLFKNSTPFTTILDSEENNTPVSNTYGTGTTPLSATGISLSLNANDILYYSCKNYNPSYVVTIYGTDVNDTSPTYFTYISLFRIA
tara:strand:+ start:3283 stop:3810 length:528 start_codon:yes stop_codon:yes gene_type:complete